MSERVELQRMIDSFTTVEDGGKRVLKGDPVELENEVAAMTLNVQQNKEVANSIKYNSVRHLGATALIRAEGLCANQHLVRTRQLTFSQAPEDGAAICLLAGRDCRLPRLCFALLCAGTFN